MNLLRNLILVFSLIVIPNSLKANNKVNYEAEIFLRSNLTTICDAYKKNLISYETNKKLKALGLEMHATYYPGLEYEKNQSVSKIYSEAYPNEQTRVIKTLVEVDPSNSSLYQSITNKNERR